MVWDSVGWCGMVCVWVGERYHWMTKAETRKLRPTEEWPYFRRKVIRKPNPIKIITCTSMNMP